MQIPIDVLCQLPEQHTEQVRKQRSCKIQTLLSEVVTVIQISPFKSGKQQTVDHVAKKVRLLRLRAFRHGDVGKHLLLQNLLRVPNTTLTGETRCRATVANEVERNLRPL